MVYYSSDELLIRDMTDTDPIEIFREEIAQGHHRTIDQFNKRLDAKASNIAFPLVAIYKGKIAGYINVYINAKPNPYGEGTFCEIIDLGVFHKYRRHGIGNRLMDIAEEIASQYSDTVYLSVGLHSGYGSAQRMYAKRGYIPDGRGAQYRESECEQYGTYCLDDDLVLGMSKKVR